MKPGRVRDGLKEIAVQVAVEVARPAAQRLGQWLSEAGRKHDGSRTPEPKIERKEPTE